MKLRATLVIAAVALFALVSFASASPHARASSSLGTLPGQVWLADAGSTCIYKPCSYTWAEVSSTGVVTHLGSGTSLGVYDVTPGTHTYRLKVSERTYRNPTNPTSYAYTSITVPSY